MGENTPNDKDKRVSDVYSEIEKQLITLVSAENQAAAKNMFDDLLRMGRDGYQFAVDLIGELCTELTGVKSLQIVPKGKMEFDVDIKRKSEMTLKFKHPIAPLIELTSVTFGKEMRFGATVDKQAKGLRMNVHEGLAMTFKLGPIESTVDIKGSALLSRNDRKQLVLSTTTKIPGTDSPVTVSIPLTQLFAKRKSML